MEAKATKEATVIKEAEKNKLTEVIDKDEVLKEAEVTKEAGVVIKTEVTKDAEVMKPSEVITKADTTKNVQEAMEVEDKMETGVTIEYNELKNAKKNKNMHSPQNYFEPYKNKWLGLVSRTR